jgi:hypothetical protein
MLPDYRGLLEELKRAIQETNFCCREMEAAEESVKYARARVVEAKSIAEKLWGEVRKVEREARLSEG